MSFNLLIFSHFFRCISSLFLKCKILFSASVMCFFPLSSCRLRSGLSDLSLVRSLPFSPASEGALIFSGVAGGIVGTSELGGSAAATSSIDSVASSSSSSISPSSKSISSFLSGDSSSSALLLFKKKL